MIRAAITGVGGWVPDDILTNEELSKMVDTSDEWIMSRVGIKERRILKGEGRGTSEMGIKAVENLLQKTNTKPEDIQIIIFATTTPDFQFPSTAALVAEGVGIKNAFCFDLQGACSGFIYALETGSNFIRSGAYKKVIVLGGDKMSSITNYEDRTTCPLFGDTAAAVLLEPTTEECGVMDSILHTDGVGIPYLNMKGGGSAYPSSYETIDNKWHYVYQEGQAVFKHAVTKMADVSAEIMERNHLSNEDVNWFVPHQANLRIIDAARKRMGLTEDKVMINIQKYGNSSAGTIPTCLNEWESKLKKGDNIILAAFGAGFTWGSVYLKWAYDSQK
ncbi:MAG: beta-ketoacyl-ACP synthase III [Dysgonamonadaceae bacterium]